MASAPDFLGLLGDEERRDLEAIGTSRRAPRGQAILAEGQVADRVIVLRAGHVKVVASGPEGHEVVLTFRGPGALLGEQAVVDGAPRAAGAVAVEPLDMLVVPASAFRRYLDERPAICMALVSLLSRRLRDSDRRLVQFATADTMGRVAARLVELCDEHGEPGPDGGVRITLPLTQEDLAGWTGSSLEATGKALRQMRRLGWIATARRSITVHDVAAVRARAG
ncbi:MAG: Crp/Fnr family transcriptional regulator [Solirubrobacterales bacterium]|nr:Crp/Fnr family transcriptional regulator [Solirubrobacterales bacterium]